MPSLNLSIVKRLALLPLMFLFCIPLMEQKPKKAKKKKNKDPIVLDDDTHVGKVQKPEVFYDLPEWVLMSKKINDILQPFNPQGTPPLEANIEYLESRLLICAGADDPDTLFQCANIELALSWLTWTVARDKYDLEFQQYYENKSSVAPVEPQLDCGKAIELYLQIQQKFPQYDHSDEVSYILGACYNEIDKTDEAKKAWLTFACPGGLSKKKKDPYHGCKPLKKGSKILPEIWFSVGDYHFDLDYSPSGLASAISAFKHAVEDKKSDFYGLFLNKLAWSFYRYGNCPQAVEYFIKVIELADSKTATKSSHKTCYRPEAIQFMTVCLLREDWDGDFVPDSKTTIEKLKDPALFPKNKTWVPEVYLALGHIYRDTGRIKACEAHKDEEIKKGKFVERDTLQWADEGVSKNGTKKYKVLVLPSAMQKLVDALMKYAELFPEDEKNTPLFLSAACRILFNYGHFDEATDIVKKLMKSYCGPEKSDLPFCQKAKKYLDLMGK